jgi:hypothetical protein
MPGTVACQCDDGIRKLIPRHRSHGRRPRPRRGAPRNDGMPETPRRVFLRRGAGCVRHDRRVQFPVCLGDRPRRGRRRSGEGFPQRVNPERRHRIEIKESEDPIMRNFHAAAVSGSCRRHSPSPMRAVRERPRRIFRKISSCNFRKTGTAAVLHKRSHLSEVYMDIREDNPHPPYAEPANESRPASGQAGKQASRQGGKRASRQAGKGKTRERKNGKRTSNEE